MWRCMAADWQTVSKRPHIPEERGRERIDRQAAICVCACVCACAVHLGLIVFFYLLTCLFMYSVWPNIVGWESDSSDAVREAVSTEVKSYGCQW